jgi:hypothetical protein
MQFTYNLVDGLDRFEKERTARFFENIFTFSFLSLKLTQPLAFISAFPSQKTEQKSTTPIPKSKFVLHFRFHILGSSEMFFCTGYT